MRRYTRLGLVLLVALLPLEMAGLCALAMYAYGLVRYDPAYFDQDHVEQYSSAEVAVRTLEVALQTDNLVLLDELQGLRWPARFETSPSLRFVRLRERSDRYTTYLFFDGQTLERHAYHFEQVRGRWVVSPPDLYYYVHSGQWRHTFWPLAAAWWLLLARASLSVLLFRTVKSRNARLYGEE
jgi:hypothetical protein